MTPTLKLLLTFSSQILLAGAGAAGGAADPSFDAALDLEAARHRLIVVVRVVRFANDDNPSLDSTLDLQAASQRLVVLRASSTSLDVCFDFHTALLLFDITAQRFLTRSSALRLTNTSLICTGENERENRSRGMRAHKKIFSRLSVSPSFFACIGMR